MTPKMRALLKQKEGLLADARLLTTTADAAGRDLTEDETKSFDALMDQADGIVASIAREQKLLDMEATAGAVEIPDGAEIVVGDAAAAADPKRGFESMGEFAASVKAASMKSGAVLDDRLMIGAEVPTSAGNEAVGEDGGFTVPPEWRQEIMRVVGDEESLFGMTDQLPISRNSLKLPMDETSPWDTTNGIQAAWEDELAELNQTKPKFKDTEYNARKCTALVPVSSELLEDNTAMDAYLRDKAPSKIGFKLDLGVVSGTGAGQPLGFLNSPGLITVAKESGQSADTVVRANINKMWQRMPAANRRMAVWLINQDIEEQLQELQFVGTESPVALYMPVGGLSVSPFDTIKGRPVIYHQAANTLGDKGDISLVDWNQYQTVVKQGGIRVDVSMHLYFDADAMAYRFIVRAGGAPKISAPIQPRAGGNTMSHFVTLAERS